jgi:hypothetical protein
MTTLCRELKQHWAGIVGHSKTIATASGEKRKRLKGFFLHVFVPSLSCQIAVLHVKNAQKSVGLFFAVFPKGWMSCGATGWSGTAGLVHVWGRFSTCSGQY